MLKRNEIIKEINSIGFMGWAVLYSLMGILCWGFGGQELPQPSLPNSIDSNQSLSETQVSYLSSIYTVFGAFEIEAEDVDDNDYSNRKSCQRLSYPSVPSKQTVVSLFPAQKLIKLYILFHSWKSFLAT
jgi:hypothetical protein